jgi:4-hydroxybenzoate polyprenyltransferase
VTLLRRLQLFFALSRTPHGLIDMAAPAVAALLCLGHFPPLAVTMVGLITVFAGYTAVYALNDLVDFNVDQRKAEAGGLHSTGGDLDGVIIRHPLAKGILSFRAGLAWAVAWAGVALAGAYWLNPVCVYIFLAGALLEGVYCKLWQVTPLRALVNGAVKTLGPLAAVYAVDPSPAPLFLVTLFLWLFAWEIGGQNIPNDWTDIEEDRRFQAQTIPIRLGLPRAALIIVGCLICALFLNIATLLASPLTFGTVHMIAVVGINLVLLLRPAFLLGEHGQAAQAMALFNKASYYPLANLLLVLLRLAYDA